MKDTDRLLSAASELLRENPSNLGSWSKMSAFLIRQALEAALDELWGATRPEMAETSFRTQFLCLPLFLHDDPTSRQVHDTWSVLSRASHHHAYELAPTTAELLSLVQDVQDLEAAIARVGKSGFDFVD